MERLNKSLILNILVIVSIAAVLLIFTSLFLRFYTKHSKETFLPPAKNKDFNSVFHALDSLNFDIEVDSTYDPKYKPGQIIHQIPKGGRKVKYGRNILVVYNQYIRPRVRLPNFVNLSLRSATILLKKNLLLMGDTVFKHDITKGIILEQWVNGKKLPPGMEIPVGLKVSFVVSAGLGEPNIPMQLLIGKTYPEMMQFMKMNELNPQIIWSGLIYDTAGAKVYMQYPMHIDGYNQRIYVAAGELINVSIMQNPSDSLLKRNAHVEIVPLPVEEYDYDYNFDYNNPGDDIIDLNATEVGNDVLNENPENNESTSPNQPPASGGDKTNPGQKNNTPKDEPNKPKGVTPKKDE